ncbi:MAG: SGNH/GDSL hydrolase family protein [Pirellulaceae bacterium]|nr:SGNH/GDSL hydrolase family protein [Pirellulaceae bacterium]
MIQSSPISKLILFASVFAFVVGAVHAADQQAKPKKKRRPPNPAMKSIADDPNLPRVLLIGDSISIGYTVPVRQLLAGKANVHRPPANCGPTTRGLESIDAWLGDGRWDVIHFNWGLHDLKYMGPTGRNLADPDTSDSHQQVPIEQYEANLRKLVERMQRTDATLIWCSTTPVPKGAKGRVVGDAAKYNEVAAKIAKESGIAVDDLYGFARPRLAEIQMPANVHFTPSGSKELAKQVVASINAALKSR